MNTHFARHLLPWALAWLGTAPAAAASLEYHFSGLYQTQAAGQAVSLAYTGQFTVSNPVATPVRPAYAADVSSPSYAGLWSGSSDFYTGAGQLQLSFANGATMSATTLGLVVNRTSLSGPGAPYPLGLSVQLYAPGTHSSGMVAGKVCPDGSVDAVCDDSGVDPLYRRGDASDLATQRLTGLYFAFWGAPSSASASGVPDLAATFGAGRGGLGLYATNDLGQSTTTLTTFNQLSAVSTVPEPAAAALFAPGLLLLVAAARRRRA